MSALLRVVRRMDILIGALRRSVTSMDKVYISGLKGLRTEMVAYIKKQVARKRAGQVGVAADSCDDDGEEVHSASQASESEEEEEQEKQEEEEQEKQEQEKQLEGEQEEEVEWEELEVEYVTVGSAETGGRSADVENEEWEGKGAMSAELGKEKEDVGVKAAHGGSGKFVVGDGKEVVDLFAVGKGDNAAATKQMGVEVPTGGERSRKKKATSGHPGSTAAGRQARLDVLEQLRAENMRLRADNARLERRLGEQTGRVDSLASALAGVLDSLTAQVADTDRNSAKRLEDATSTMTTTITDNLTDNMDSAIQAGKSFAELATKILRDIDDPNGRMAVDHATAHNALADHVTNKVDEARNGLEEAFIKYIAAAHTNIAAAVTPRLVVQQPPPPIAPTQALPEEFMKSFKEDMLKAVTEATHQSFLASGMKIMTEVVGTVAPGRRGSSPSANDAVQTQQKEAQKQGQKRGGWGGGGDGDDSTSVKRSKGAGGSRVTGEGSKGAGGLRVAGNGSKGVVEGSSAKQTKSVVDILKKHWADVRSPTTGRGVGSAAGGSADQNAAKDAGPSAPPLVAEKPPRQGSGGKGFSDKEIPAAKTAPGGAAGTGLTPNAEKVEASAVPQQPPAGARPPTGPLADKDGRAGKGAAAANALKDRLRLLTGHRAVQQPPPPVDAHLAETTARSTDPIFAVPSASVPRVAPAVAAHTSADPKSALLRAHGAAPALATGGGPVEEVAPDADIAAIQAHLDAAKPRTLAISGTTHVEHSASPAGGSAERKTTADVVGEGKAKRKGKAGSQRKTRDKSEVKTAETADTGGGGKVMSVEKGKAGENQERSVGEGTSTGRKGKENSVGQGTSTGTNGKEKSVGEGTLTGRKGKEKAAEKRKEKEEEEEEEEDDEEEQEEEEGKDKAKDKEKGRRGHGIRHDSSGDGLGWVGEIKLRRCAPRRALAGEWFPVEGELEEKSAAMMSAMIGRVSMCVAYGKTAASASKKEGDEEEKTAMAAWALATSACAVWCFVENDDAQVVDAVEEGKAAAIIAGASEKTADVFETVMAAVLNAEINRDRPLGEVAFNIAPALQSLALQRVYPGGNAGVDAEVVARATVETMAFWGMCPVVAPKLKKKMIAVPCDA
ncbi:unnamed protein product [Closterium sp. Naga37s-1]|nr:unnamed protein product [Closterium sp. Naga37s-1]